MPSKPLWKSKVFWVNVLGGIGTYAGYLPAKYSGPTLAVANVLLRLITNTQISGVV